MRALVVHPGEGERAALRALVARRSPCESARGVEEMAARLGEHAYSLVVLVHDPPAVDAAACFERVTARAPHAVVVVIADRDRETRFLEGPAGARSFRFAGRLHTSADDNALLEGTIAAALRIGELEQQGRELQQRLSAADLKLVEHERLMDGVVQERTRDLEVAYRRVKTANRDALLALADAIEAKDAYTRGHCGRVAAYTMALARAANYPAADLETLEFAAFLHDIGKIGVRDSVLLKAGALDDDEWKHMRSHSLLGDQIASQSELLQPMRPAIRNHHERWDGNGYPDKLKGEAIPLSARIVCITDAFDAMVTDRPYKKALTHADSVYYLRKYQGSQFDPELVEIWLGNKLGELFVSE